MKKIVILLIKDESSGFIPEKQNEHSKNTDGKKALITCKCFLYFNVPS